MQGNQLLILIGAIVLFTILSLNTYESVFNSSEITLNSEYILTALEVAEDITNQISEKSWDEATISTFVQDSLFFTSPAAFGPDAGEVYPYFDDIDDFDNYSHVISTPRMGDYNSEIDVDYVTPNNPDVPVSFQTHIKRIKVEISWNSENKSVTLYYYSCY
jgi:hypothetical protein